MAPSSGFKHIQSVITQIVEHIDTLDTQGHPMAVGLTTGFRSLDKQFLLGLRPGELTAVAGRFNMGKTSLLAHLAIHAGCQEGVKTDCRRGQRTCDMGLNAAMTRDSRNRRETARSRA